MRRRRPQDDPSRRDIMRMAACAAVGTTSLVSTVWDLRMVNAAVAPRVNLGADYKALVCLFLYGGNDANNLIIQTGTTDYANYTAARGPLALPNKGSPGGVLQLGNPVEYVDAAGHTYGVHPSCTGMQTLFDAGKLAFVANVGTLVGPITRAQYLAGTAAKPPQLFSHSDQQVQWQTSVPDQVSRTGWGGRCADLLYSLNGNAQVSLSMSLAGANTFEVGNIINAYNLSTSFPNMGITLANVSGTRLQALKDLVAMGHPNLHEDAFSLVTNRAINNAAAVNTATNAFTTAFPAGFTTAFPNTSLGKQLANIARLIYGSTALGHQRQIFFCSVGGYDTHGDQLNAQTSLYTELSNSLKAFYDATVQLGCAPNVTTFTASDFGRTFPYNSGGTDHGWGSHQIVMGGSVVGKKIYGTFPTLQVNGPDDTSTGRWIPTTAVDEFSATIAKWFGVAQTDMATVFPNIGRFAHPDMGFMG